MTTIQTVIVLATAKRRHLHQMDVKNTFLQGELDEGMYMVQLVEYGCIMAVLTLSLGQSRFKLFL